MEKKKSNPIALLPIGVFLVLYLGMGLVFEYVLRIEMGSPSWWCSWRRCWWLSSRTGP